MQREGLEKHLVVLRSLQGRVQVIQNHLGLLHALREVQGLGLEEQGDLVRGIALEILGAGGLQFKIFLLGEEFL